MNSEKQKELLKIELELKKRFGENSVMRATEVPVYPMISSGSISLDFAIGGGFPQDRCIEIFGENRSGKTTLGLIAMCNFLDENPDRSALILDIEHKLTMEWVERLIGSERMGRTTVLWPRHIEEATDMYVQALESEQYCFCLLDSIGGAPTIRTIQTAAGERKSAETGNQGGNSLGVTRFSQTAEIYSHIYRCLTIGINQVRDNFGPSFSYDTPGGHAWKHACALRLFIKRVPREEVFEKIDGADVRVGFKVVAKALKNHLPGGVEDRLANWWFFNIYTEKYGFGIDRTDEIVRHAILTGLVDQRGAWYYHQALEGGKIQSLAKLTDEVKSDQSLRETLTSELLVRMSDRDSVSKVVEGNEEVSEVFKEGESE